MCELDRRITLLSGQLSIVKHIVQSHGGKVWVKSEPGKGATFFFTLPAASDGTRAATVS